MPASVVHDRWQAGVVCASVSWAYPYAARATEETPTAGDIFVPQPRSASTGRACCVTPRFGLSLGRGMSGVCAGNGAGADGSSGAEVAADAEWAGRGAVCGMSHRPLAPKVAMTPIRARP